MGAEIAMNTFAVCRYQTGAQTPARMSWEETKSTGPSTCLRKLGFSEASVAMGKNGLFPPRDVIPAGGLEFPPHISIFRETSG